jgi:nucleotidyltransferase-like protein
MLPSTVTTLCQIITDWAQRTPDLRALGMVGSQARGTPRPNSDLDLLILARRPRRYFSGTTWSGSIGFETAGYGVVSCAVVDYGPRRSYRFRLLPAAELELIFAPLAWACINPIDPASARIVRDGLSVLVDKDGLFHHLCIALGSA